MYMLLNMIRLSDLTQEHPPGHRLLSPLTVFCIGPVQVHFFLTCVCVPRGRNNTGKCKRGKTNKAEGAEVLNVLLLQGLLAGCRGEAEKVDALHSKRRGESGRRAGRWERSTGHRRRAGRSEGNSAPVESPFQNAICYIRHLHFACK